MWMLIVDLFVDCEKMIRVRNPNKEVVLPSIFDNNHHFSLDFYYYFFYFFLSLSLLLLAEEEDPEEDDELPEDELDDEEDEELHIPLYIPSSLILSTSISISTVFR